MMIRIFMTVLAIVFLGCATPSHSNKVYNPELVQHIKGSSFKATERGYYTAELVTDPEQPVVGENSAQLIIHDYTATDRPGLSIVAVPYLPAKGIESDKRVWINDVGRGLYLLEGIYFSEPGNWQMKISISGPEEMDRVTLDLPEVK